jgi:uracil-DNA glycosylase family 4
MQNTDVKALAHTVEILYGELWNFPWLEEKKSLATEAPPIADGKAPSGTWRELKEQVRLCKNCDLHLNRAHSVFGRGEFTSPIIFLGDFPALEDDKKGEIFSGAEGELLNKMILAMKLKPAEMYFTNFFKCRSSSLPSPSDEFSLACVAHLEKEFSFLQAKIVVALGPWASKIAANSESPLATLRGQTFSFLGKEVYCTYHPRDLLQSPNLKKLAWEDLQRVMKSMGVL